MKKPPGNANSSRLIRAWQQQVQVRGFVSCSMCFLLDGSCRELNGSSRELSGSSHPAPGSSHPARSKGNDLSKARRAAYCLFRASGTVPSTCCKSGWRSACQLDRQAPSCLRACTTEQTRPGALREGTKFARHGEYDAAELFSRNSCPRYNAAHSASGRSAYSRAQARQEREARKTGQCHHAFSYPVKSVHVR